MRKRRSLARVRRLRGLPGGGARAVARARAGPAVAGLAGVMRRLDRRRAQAPGLIDPVVKAMDATLVALDGAQAALETALRETAFEPGELERVEERLFALRAAARKHGSSVDQLP